MTTFEYYEIIDEKSFAEKLTGLKPIHERILEIHEAITWRLGKNQEGTAIPGFPDYRVYKTVPIGDIPSFWVLFKVDNPGEKVHLISLEPVEEKEE